MNDFVDLLRELEATPQLNFSHQDNPDWSYAINLLIANQESFGTALNICEKLKDSLMEKILRSQDFLKRPNQEPDIILSMQSNLQFFKYMHASFQNKINNLLTYQ